MVVHPSHGALSPSSPCTGHQTVSITATIGLTSRTQKRKGVGEQRDITVVNESKEVVWRENVRDKRVKDELEV